MIHSKPISLFWFRRDLRLDDNRALYHALLGKHPVLPIFIFDANILDKIENKEDRRVSFIWDQLLQIKAKLNTLGSDIKIFYGEPKTIFKSLLTANQIDSIYINNDYEPYAIKRDNEIHQLAKQHNTLFLSYKDQVIFEKNEVVKNDGKPYTVFTPYSKKWIEKLHNTTIEIYPSESKLQNVLKIEPEKEFDLSATGFSKIPHLVPPLNINTDVISNYHNTRDYPSLNGTSRLSVHLRFGTVSTRHLLTIAITLNPTFVNELIWREFYKMILWHFPHVEQSAFKSAYNHLPWVNNPSDFDAWCNGETGYPLVDAGMKELNQTGYMHNRIRMITASFLTKHLLIDWRLGEAYFAEKLTDFELSSNNGGWQWASGSGCDAAPYFRIFNPYTQAKKFDPDNAYISKWLGGNTPLIKPIVDHKFARERAIKVYKETLEKFKQ